MRLHNITDQRMITPEMALTFLEEGNKRFIDNLNTNRDLLEQVNATQNGQFPFATVLSCIDSRTSAELIFDQGLGDIFSIRIAGNILNDDIIGSMEFACKIAGSKLIVILGHSKCGAVTGACGETKLGYLTNLLEKIQPAIDYVKTNYATADLSDNSGIDLVATHNVKHVISELLNKSTVLRDLFDNGELGIVGAFYNVESGEVQFEKALFSKKQ